MNYYEFRDRALEEIMGYMPKKYADYIIKLERINKVNHTKECFHIRPKEEMAVVPNIYVDDLYNAYIKGLSFEDTMKMAVEYYTKALEMGKTFSEKMDNALSKDNIVFQLVNTEKNSNLIKNVPHRSWLNLTIIYRAVVNTPDGGFYSTVINNEIASMRNWCECELFELAMMNSPCILPGVVMEMADEFKIITNCHQSLGAGAVLYENLLEKIADEFQDDLYLIPSSIHEMLALPAGSRRAEELEALLKECNENVLENCDILSDKIYRYSRGSLGKVTIA